MDDHARDTNSNDDRDMITALAVLVIGLAVMVIGFAADLVVVTVIGIVVTLVGAYLCGARLSRRSSR